MASFSEIGEVNYAIDFDGSRFGIPFAVYALNDKDDIVREIFIPHEKQIRFFSSLLPFILFGGARGGGKTAALVWKAIFTCLRIPECKVLILRRTMPQLKKTVIPYFLDYVPDALYVRYNASDKVARFENGSTLWFGSCDSEESVRQYLSGEFVLIELDEQSEFSYYMWNFLKGSLRNKRKFDSFGNPIIPQLVGATNPGGIGGEFCRALFVYKKQVPGEDPTLYQLKEYDFIQSLVTDNPTYREDINYRKMLDSLPPALRAAWRDGAWDSFEGQFFETFDVSATSISSDEVYALMRSQPWQPKWISIDWGYQHHSVVLWHTMVELHSSNGKSSATVALTYRELAANHTSERALAQLIADYTGPQTPAQAKARGMSEEDVERIDKIYLDSACFGDGINSRADQIGEVLRFNKLPSPDLSDKDRVDGWRFMHQKLSSRNDMGSRKYSDWIISEKCPQLLQSLPLLLRDPQDLEDVKKTSTLADDFGDCARYGIKTHLGPKNKPFDTVRAETLAKCANNNQRYMTDLRMQDKRRKFQQRLMNRGRVGRHR